jgi:hypothetical protein
VFLLFILFVSDYLSWIVAGDHDLSDSW